MPKNIKVLRVGIPIKLASLRTLLDTIDDDAEHDAIVTYYNRELIVERPAPTLLDEGDE